MTNPFCETWDTPYGLPPFERIEPGHFEEAFDKAFAEHRAEVKAIAEAPGPATFKNTVEALERSGALLDRIEKVFSNFTSANMDDALKEVEKRIAPRLAAHRSAIWSDPVLFHRVDTLYRSEQGRRLEDEQARLLAETRKSLVRAGAALQDDDRAKVRDLDETLAGLKTQFARNLLEETNDFELVLDNDEDLAGLPESVLKSAAAEAERRGKPGKYVFTISRSSITPFLQYADRRDLREKMFSAYRRCANQGGQRDNKAIAARIAALRARRARLLGYASHAEYQLDDRMAATPEAVAELFERIWQPAKERVHREAEDLQSKIQEAGGNFRLEPWDWWYYTERIRSERFDFDAEDVKPWFELENVRDGAFEVASRLYGLTFTRVDDVPVYHPDVQAFEVHEADGRFIGLMLLDYFMRPSKRGGAWMSTFRDQSSLDDFAYPIVVNCCNFAKSDPCLLTMDEVTTLFHEFGHGLHGLLSNVTYRSLSGTSVKRDFVELPSQLMEHWATEPEVMKWYARHYQTGEAISDDMIGKIRASATFNQGFKTTEYLAATWLDMAWHSLETDEEQDVEAFEAETMADIGLVDVVHPRYHSTYFQHIFAKDSYSAGYYVYIWAEVLDADAYQAFRERGIFDSDTAGAFRRCILERGGSADPMTLYRAFRGREPAVEPLLAQRGLLAKRRQGQ